MEDNKATIQLVTDGASTADRSKHVHIRNSFVFQFLDIGVMEIRHCPTKKMLADLLAKLKLKNEAISNVHMLRSVCCTCTQG